MYLDAYDGALRSSSPASSSFPIDASKPFDVVSLPLRILDGGSSSAAASSSASDTVEVPAEGAAAAKEAAAKTSSVMAVTGFSSRGNGEPVACIMSSSSGGGAGGSGEIDISGGSEEELVKARVALASTAHAGRTFFHVLDAEVGSVESRLLTSLLPSPFSSSSLSSCFASVAVGKALYMEALSAVVSADDDGSSSSSSSSSSAAAAATAAATEGSSSCGGGGGGGGGGVRTIAVAYPRSTDVVNAPAQILGDDSLLLKYRNAHLMAVMSEAPPADSVKPPRHTATTAPAGGSGGTPLVATSLPSIQVSHSVTQSPGKGEIFIV